jgi:hypothetical protein
MIKGGSFYKKKEYNATGEEGEGLLPAGRDRRLRQREGHGLHKSPGEVVITMVFEDAGALKGAMQ